MSCTCTGRFTLDLYKPDEFMRLDVAAQRALHIFPARGEARGASSNASVYGLLNHTRTAMGKRLLRSWLKQPLTDVAAINERHAIVAAFVEDQELRCACDRVQVVVTLFVMQASGSQQDHVCTASCRRHLTLAHVVG